jgi:4-alpha-glucanotransferase
MDGARGADGISDLAARARALNRDRLIDRDRVYELKLQAFEILWARVRERADRESVAYTHEMGEPLQEYATFCALTERFESGWHAWPAEYRTPTSVAVRSAAADPRFADRVRFHSWLQFQLDRQVARAARVLPIMQDLPIGFDPDGADAWSFQDVLAAGVTVGAPPDEFNTKGQNWGLPPFVPQRLRSGGYAPFIQTIRACLRDAGGLRIDHVMGLFRLFWIPNGMEPSGGTYVRNPAEDLLSIVALESHRARAVIVGEDLGTVEREVHEALSKRSILSYRLVWFEKGPPRRYPRQALAAVTTHDLPTVAGLWTGADLEAQKRLHLAPNEEGTHEIHQRVAALTGATGRTSVTEVIARLHDVLADAPSRIVTATLEDAMAVDERPNMPASGDGWPNWSLALPKPLESLEQDGLASRIAGALRRRRSLKRDGPAGTQAAREDSRRRGPQRSSSRTASSSGRR